MSAASNPTDVPTQGRAATQSQTQTGGGRTPVLQGRGLVKTFGRVIGLDGVDIELYPGEVLAVIGDRGDPRMNAAHYSLWVSTRWDI
jgi:hypothetical protein